MTPEKPPMCDKELMDELDKIEAETLRRKKARPLEPFAVWAMTEQMAALDRFNKRHPL